jgi:hypothetical protein
MDQKANGVEAVIAVILPQGGTALNGSSSLSI